MSEPKPQPIPEHLAEGEIERVYHEIQSTLRVTGIHASIEQVAGYGDLLPLLWDAVRPRVETRRFEDSADLLRIEGARAAIALGVPGASAQAPLGESQRYRRRRMLDLYHYLGPKLLLLHTMWLQALESFDGEPEPRLRAPLDEPEEILIRGVPLEMHAMELVSEEPRDARLRELFAEIRKSLRVSRVPDEHRALAAWPDYLECAWERLKIFTARSRYLRAVEALRGSAREHAGSLRKSMALSRRSVEASGHDPDEILLLLREFSTQQAPRIIDVALLELDWRSAATLAESPFPAPSLPSPVLAELRGLR